MRKNSVEVFFHGNKRIVVPTSFSNGLGLTVSLYALTGAGLGGTIYYDGSYHKINLGVLGFFTGMGGVVGGMIGMLGSPFWPVTLPMLILGVPISMMNIDKPYRH